MGGIRVAFKRFKTGIRKMMGCVGIAEFVKDSVAFNSHSSWNTLYTNTRFLREYVVKGRLDSYREIIDIMVKHGVLDGVSSMLDVGCGTGHFLLEISKRYPDIALTASDFSNEGLQVVKGVLKDCGNSVEVVESDITRINPLWCHCFDVVCCSEVLEHLLNPEEALGNLLGYVKVGGVLVLGVPNGRMDTYEGHIQFWSPESWRGFLLKNVGERYRVTTLLFCNNRNNLAIIHC